MRAYYSFKHSIVSRVEFEDSLKTPEYPLPEEPLIYATLSYVVLPLEDPVLVCVYTGTVMGPYYKQGDKPHPVNRYCHKMPKGATIVLTQDGEF